MRLVRLQRGQALNLQEIWVNADLVIAVTGYNTVATPLKGSEPRTRVFQGPGEECWEFALPVEDVIEYLRSGSGV